MADEEEGAQEQQQIVATVTVALSGSPKSGLRIVADGAATDCPADWDEAAEGVQVGERVTALVQNPKRPRVMAKPQIEVPL